MLDDMQRRGVIEESDSSWSYPVALVRRKNGELCFCLDYRKWTNVIKKGCFPLPRIDYTLDTLAGAKWFSTLDLKLDIGNICAPGRQRENGILEWSRVMAVHSHALWPVQRSGDIWKAHGDGSARSHLRFMSRILRRRDRNWAHFRRAPAQFAESISAIPGSLPNA
jgi:hypothetical protein